MLNVLVLYSSCIELVKLPHQILKPVLKRFKACRWPSHHPTLQTLQ